MKPYSLVCGLLTGLALAACSPTTTPSTPNPSSTNLFGAMLGGTLPSRLAAARSLSLALFRDPLAVSSWPLYSSNIDTFISAGYKFIPTVRYCASGGCVSGPVAPADAPTFKTTMQAMANKFKPQVMVIENEEGNPKFYSGAVGDYLNELRLASQVVGPLGVKVANGGITSTPSVLLVYFDYWSRGLTAQANSLIDRTVRLDYPDIANALPNLTDRRFQPVVAFYQAELQAIKAGTVPVDYVNFHWYYSDASALGEVIDGLGRLSGKPVMSNEMGLYQTTDPDNVVGSELKTALAHNLAYLLWFSMDGDPTQNNGNPKSKVAQALQNPDGSLRQTGLNFQAFMQIYGWAK